MPLWFLALPFLFCYKYSAVFCNWFFLPSPVLRLVIKGSKYMKTSASFGTTQSFVTI